MLYAIFEIMLFLLVAAFLGFVIGWMLKARGGSKWQTAYDRERQASSRLRQQLEECNKSAEARVEEAKKSVQVEKDNKSTNIVTATKPAATKPAATKPAAAKPAKKSASKAKVAAADELPDKASAVKGMAAIAKRTAAGKKVNDDDLKKIKGVGPKLEKLLKGMGITSYRQVANLKKEDINIVTAAIESFPGRIERDNWMRSAGKLHKDIYGAMP